jgi:hypothetical protein
MRKIQNITKHDKLRTNHSINDEFNLKDFFDNMNDEHVFEILYYY